MSEKKKKKPDPKGYNFLNIFSKKTWMSENRPTAGKGLMWEEYVTTKG